MPKYYRNILLVYIFLLLSLPAVVWGAVFNVSTVEELETALAAADSNGENDTINISAGTYDLTATLTYTPSDDPVENYSLTIQSTGDQIILDGGNSYRIFKIKTLIAGKDTSDAHITIKGITFRNGRIDDSSTFMGAGLNVWTHNSNITIEDSEFINNIAYHLYRDSEVGGAFIKAGGSGTATLTNNTFSDNGVGPWSGCIGGGLYVHLYSDGSTANIYNNIIWDNTATSGTGQDLYLEDDGDNSGTGATVNLYNNDFSDLDYHVGDNISQGDNIDQDPLFVGGGNYHLTSSSPCIDSGTSSGAPSTDIEGNSRPRGGAYDMGAYEYDGFPTCPECSGSPVVLANVTFNADTACECSDATSITIGNGVTVKSGATVIFKAPTVKLQPGFHAENGSTVNIRQE